MPVILAFLASLICFGTPGPVSVSVAVVKHLESLDFEVVAGDAQCRNCPCWLPPLITQYGCSIAQTGCSSCGYVNINELAIPWGPAGASDANGCVDADLLPVPQGQWVYWIRAAP